MKQPRTTFFRLMMAMLLLLTAPALNAQWIGANAFMDGTFVEVGVSQCSGYGTPSAPPAGYHPRSPGGGLGFVADPARDGWLSGSPNYCGDYFLPGSPVEGWAVEVGSFSGSSLINSDVCGSFGIPGSITGYVATPTQQRTIWESSGTVLGGLSAKVETIVKDSTAYFVGKVTLTNTSASDMYDVYFLRQVDPDNDQQLSGSYTTLNEVLSQPSPASCDALVTAQGLTYGICYLGLGSRDPRARVSYGGFSLFDCSDVWNGYSPYSSSGTSTADEAISLAFKEDTLAAGDSTVFFYAYILDVGDLAEALSATVPYTVETGTGEDITDTLSYTICRGSSTTITITEPSDYTWSWGPPAGLDTTDGHTVTITPDSSVTEVTYTVTGVGGCDPITFDITIYVDTTIVSSAEAGPDTTACPGIPVMLDGSGGVSYSWSPAGYLDNPFVENPVATVGATTVFYATVTNALGCVGTDSMTVFMTSQPVDAGPDYGPICESSSTMIGGSPTADTTVAVVNWTAVPAGDTSWLSSTTAYNPIVTPPSGAHGTTMFIVSLIDTITGCTDIDTMLYTVDSIATASISVTATGLAPDSAYCIDNGIVPLTLSPTGGDYDGTLTGPGTSGSNFDPALAGVGGPYTIMYYYQDTVTGCMDSAMADIWVSDLPGSAFTGLDTSYCDYDEAVTLIGTPSGGTFFGPGIIDSTFNPATAGPGGPYTIGYTVTNSLGCVDTMLQTVTVYPGPVANIAGLDTGYCEYAPLVNLTLTPAGGILSGPGTTGSNFDPALAGVGGPYDIQYAVMTAGGCVDTTVLQTSVNPRPVVSFSGLDTLYCDADEAATLVGAPAGGTFFGPGISGSTFTPAAAGVGGPYTIGYTYTTVAGCTDTMLQTVTVYTSVIPSLNGLQVDYCEHYGADTLVGLPAGGVFVGTGLTDSIFDPGTAGVGGPYPIQYIYTTPEGCVDTAIEHTTVHAKPVASISGLDATYCATSPTVTLTGTPAGGTFSGPGMAGTNFNPGVAGTGVTHTITYIYSDAFGCGDTTTATTFVDTIPDASFTGLASDYCVSEAAVTLTPVHAGGTFSGPGISGTTFDPGVAGVGGPYSIQYVYVEPTTGCMDSTTQLVNVNGLPNPDILTLDPHYCIDASAAMINATPAGGTLSGTGITGGNMFDPSVAGIGGPYDITYVVTDGNGCIDSVTESTQVRPLPTPDFTGLAADYCVDAAAATLTGIPAGGSFVGPGVSGSSFNPATAGVGGPYIITYDYTDSWGCSNDTTHETIVNALPPADAGADTTICQGESARLTANGGVAYSWSAGIGQSIVVTPAMSTNYTVTVTDTNGCQQTDDVFVTTVTVSLTFSMTPENCDYADDGTITVSPSGGIAPYNYIWSDGQTTQTATNLSAGVYAVTVTDDLGCSAVGSYAVNEPAPFTVSYQFEEPQCHNYNDATVSFTGSGGTPPYAFSITMDGVNFESGDNITDLPAGDYSLTAVDANGCVYQEDFTITQPDALYFGQPQITQPACFGYDDGNFIIQGFSPSVPGPYDYTLYETGETNQTGLFPNLTSGVYNVIMEDSRGCMDTAHVLMPEPPPIIVSLSPDTIILPLGETGQFVADYEPKAYYPDVRFDWTPITGLNCIDCPDPTVDNYYDQEYVVTVTDLSDPFTNEPCQGEAVGWVLVQDGIPVYVPNAFTPNNDGVNDIFEVYGESVKSMTIQVYDRWGEKLFESGNQQIGWDGMFKGQMMNPGVYIYHLKVTFLNNEQMEKTGSVTLIR